MQLSAILQASAIRSNVKIPGKKRLLQDIADLAESVHGINAANVYDGLQAREALGPTGVGRGVAIPHARLPGLDRVIGIFERLEKPIDFSAVDHQPVDLVFALLAPEDAGVEHLKALARVSRTLRDEATCAKLRSTSEPAALYAILTEDPASQAA
jgi:PTS system nitrogen regulatory IIA component